MDRPAPSAPPFRRLAFAVCRPYLEDESHRRAILLSGPRRVGKSTILLQVAEWLVAQGRDPRSVFYVSLDHPLLKLLPLTELLRLYRDTVHPEGKPVVPLMDEVQYAREWELRVKALVDHQPNYRIVGTGSASVVHRQKIAESGVGRWVRVSVPTLSFYEFLRTRDGEVPALSPDLGPRDLFGMSRASAT